MYCRAVNLDVRPLAEAANMYSLKTYVWGWNWTLSEKTNARVYWGDLLAVWGTIHAHFAAPNPIAIDTKDEKSTLYSIIDSTIVPQNLIPSPKSCYQIGEYVVVKYNNG